MQLYLIHQFQDSIQTNFAKNMMAKTFEVGWIAGATDRGH
jgi:hypothetical protein